MRSPLARVLTWLRTARGLRWAVVLAILLTASLVIYAAISLILKKGVIESEPEYATELYQQHLVRAGQILVKFRTPEPKLSAEQAKSLSNEIPPGSWDVTPIGHNDAFVVRSLNKKISVTTLIDTFRAPEFNRIVEDAEPDFVINFEGRSVALPTDPLFPKQWALQNTGQPLGLNACSTLHDPTAFGKPFADIKAVDAWRITTGSVENIVVVLDSGIDFNHGDLNENIWTADKRYSVSLAGEVVTCDPGTHGFDATTRDPHKQCVPMDGGTHGTHLAGIIGAELDGAGIVGVDQHVKMMAVRFIYTSDLIRALAFVIEAKKQFPNIRVVNNSYGLDEGIGSGDLNILFAEFKSANDADLLFVTSAGDDPACSDETKHFPSGFDLPNIVSVTATTNTDDTIPFSFDPDSDKLLGAPGIKICSTVPGNKYADMDGSSMAAAFVSGAAALVLSNRAARCQNLSAWGLKSALLKQAENVPKLAAKIREGRRLNAYAAVQNCSQYLLP